VAKSFRGQYSQKVDAKGRVAFPPAFRRVLESCDPDWKEGLRPQVVIVYGDHRRNYLQCFSIEAIDEVDDAIAKMPRGSTERRELEHLMTGQALPTDLDKDGRLVLPPKLLQKIGLDDQAFFIASGDTFQIWKPSTYKSDKLAKSESWRNERPDDFDILSLLNSTDEE